MKPIQTFAIRTSFLVWAVGTWFGMSADPVWAQPKLDSIAISNQGFLMGFRVLLHSSKPKIHAWMDGYGRLQWISLESRYVKLAVLPQGNVILKSFRTQGRITSRWDSNNRLVGAGYFQLQYSANNSKLVSIQWGRTTFPIRYSNVRMTKFGAVELKYHLSGSLQRVGPLKFSYQVRGFVQNAAGIAIQFQQLDWRVVSIGRSRVLYLSNNQFVVGLSGTENRTMIDVRTCQRAICPIPGQLGSPNQIPGGNAPGGVTGPSSR